MRADEWTLVPAARRVTRAGNGISRSQLRPRVSLAVLRATDSYRPRFDGELAGVSGGRCDDA
jgi:hypothetical protein